MTYYVGAIPYSVNDVAHYGRRGMKWGQHIFGDEKKSAAAASAGKSAYNVIRESSEVAGRFTKKRVSSTFKANTSKLSDDELRKRVNRLNLERQYAQLTGADTRRGAEVTREILQTTGSLVGIASGVLTTAMLIKKLR